MRLLTLLSLLALTIPSITASTSPLSRFTHRRFHIQQTNSSTDVNITTGIDVNTTTTDAPTLTPIGGAGTQAPIATNTSTSTSAPTSATTTAPTSSSGTNTTTAPTASTTTTAPTSSSGTNTSTSSTGGATPNNGEFPGPNSNPDTCPLVNFTDSIVGSTIYFNTTSTKNISYVDVHVTTRTPRAFLNYRLTRAAGNSANKVYTITLPAYVSGAVSYWFTYVAPDAANVARGCDTSISADTNVVATPSRGASSPACPVPVEFSYSIVNSTVYFASDDQALRFVEVHLTYQGQQYNYRLTQQSNVYSKVFPFTFAASNSSSLSYFYTYDNNGIQCDTASYTDAGDAVVPVVNTPSTTSAPAATSAPATTSAPAATTAPTSSGATTAPTSSGATTAPTSSGATTAPTSSGATTTPTSSGATTTPTSSSATTAPTTPIGAATVQPTEASATEAPTSASSTGGESGSGSDSDSDSDSTGSASTGAAGPATDAPTGTGSDVDVGTAATASGDAAPTATGTGSSDSDSDSDADADSTSATGNGAGVENGTGSANTGTTPVDATEAPAI